MGYTKHLSGDIDGAIESYHQALSIKTDDTFSGEMLNRALHESFLYPDPLIHQEEENDEEEQSFNDYQQQRTPFKSTREEEREEEYQVHRGLSHYLEQSAMSELDIHSPRSGTGQNNTDERARRATGTREDILLSPLDDRYPNPMDSTNNTSQNDISMDFSADDMDMSASTTATPS